MKISYGITVHNEADELNKLLEILVHKTRPNDEIIIVDDYSNQETQNVITSWSQQYSELKEDVLHLAQLNNKILYLQFQRKFLRPQ